MYSKCKICGKEENSPYKLKCNSCYRKEYYQQNKERMDEYKKRCTTKASIKKLRETTKKYDWLKDKGAFIMDGNLLDSRMQELKKTSKTHILGFEKKIKELEEDSNE